MCVYTAFVSVCGCNRTKDSFVQHTHVSSKLCALHKFSCTLMCPAHICVFLGIVAQERLELHFNVFVSLWSPAFAPGQADLGPPAFCQTPLACLSSGCNLVDFFSGKCLSIS